LPDAIHEDSDIVLHQLRQIEEIENLPQDRSLLDELFEKNNKELSDFDLMSINYE